MRASLAAARTLMIVAATSSVAAAWQRSGTPPSPPSLATSTPNVFALGNVRVTIPPPPGFEEVLSRSEEFRQRLAENERLVELAAHLPSDVAKNFVAGRDIPLYTKVSMSRAAVALDISDEFFAGVARDLAGTALYDQDFLQKFLTDVGKRRNLEFGKPLGLGTIEQTPKSVSTLAMAAITQGDRRIPLLFSTSALHVRRRLIFAYVYRIVESQKDQALVETLTRDWVRNILAANP